MALKKSHLYSSLWQSCDELRRSNFGPRMIQANARRPKAIQPNHRTSYPLSPLSQSVFSFDRQALPLSSVVFSSVIPASLPSVWLPLRHSGESRNPEDNRGNHRGEMSGVARE